MSINFEALKMGFISYLESLEKDSDSKSKETETDVSDVSIFMHAEEFKEYVSEELNIDISDMPMDLSSLMDMEIVNGELVSKDDVQNDSDDKSSATDDEKSLMTDFINELLQDEKIFYCEQYCENWHIYST